MIDLYRFYDIDDRLLYVGISFNAAQRSMQHRDPIVVRFDGDGVRCAYFCRACHNQWSCWWTRDLSILGAC